MPSDAIIAQLVNLAYVALAMLLGAAIGFERELASKPAGMRTHMLVAGAAALLVCLGEALINRIGEDVYGGAIRSDPIRIIEAIIAGVSFLGAGTIIRSRKGGSVEGLTTAAALLFTAGVGVAVALRELALSVGGALLVLITLRTVHLLERRLTSKKSSSAKSSES